MIKIGQTNQLTAVKPIDAGMLLDGGELGRILLPRRYVPEGLEPGASLKVFVYLDSNDEVIATTLTPKASVGECALLEVKDVNDAGAFLDWGLPKDLLVPYSEQHKPMEVGRRYVVCIYLDPYTGRITASSRLNRRLNEKSRNFTPGQAVDLLICGKTDMGYKAVINHTHLGLIFRDDAFRTLTYGESLKGYIKAVRSDQKLDISLQAPAAQGKPALAEQILAHLRAQGGVSELTDKSPPEAIYAAYNVSKGSYKNALSLLYKQRRILIEAHEIRLVDN